MRTIIRNVLLPDMRKTNVLLEDGVLLCLDAADGACADNSVEAEGKAILPAFYNTHTHAAMSLLRGYADDMPLKAWLEENNPDVKILVSDPPKGYNDDLSEIDIAFLQIHVPTEDDGTQDLTLMRKLI